MLAKQTINELSEKFEKLIYKLQLIKEKENKKGNDFYEDYSKNGKKQIDKIGQKIKDEELIET